ncbi:MAG: response regulator [Moraxella sp.]|nr:response regulator [Moraxella sp.]
MAKKILVVDDSPAEMARFREVLGKHDFEIIEAFNGEEGYEKACEYKPDLILMDIVMPEMNGFQATRKITRDELTKDIPVIIVSTKDQETDRVWGKRQGAREYIVKPISEDGLISIIRSVLG